MKLRVILASLFVTSLALPGCQSNSGPGQSGAIRYDPPNTEFAAGLGIAPPPPVTRDQALAIAAEAAGGTALGAEQETEGGELLYEVKVETSSGRKEVEVRASDGGVVEIEADDD
jgi:uncharacterized membrane protein YkoI